MKNDYTSNDPMEYVLRAFIIPCFFLAFGAIEAALTIFFCNIILAIVVHKRKQRILQEREKRHKLNRTTYSYYQSDELWHKYSKEKFHEFLRSNESAETFFESRSDNNK